MREEIKNLEGVLTFNGRPVMTPSRAKAVLEGMGLRTFNAARLVCGVHTLYVESGNNYVAIDHTLKPEELQAIALWMQDPEGVTNA